MKKDDGRIIEYFRVRLDGYGYNSYVWFDRNFPGDQWKHSRMTTMGGYEAEVGFQTMKEAMDDLDRELLKRGFKLLTQEQFDRLLVLV